MTDIAIDNLDITNQFEEALDLLENTQQSLFITGKAGTGKSTLLSLFRQKTKKKIVVLAPTGVAALNVKGQTIHSFFRFSPQVTVRSAKNQRIDKKTREIVKNMHTLVIDEISMVRADLMDCIDIMLRRITQSKAPFGGKQIVVIGDLYQLSPVVAYNEESNLFTDYYQSPYFFSAHALHDPLFKLIELENIFRQTDDDFISLLNHIRHDTVNHRQLDFLNDECQSYYEPEGGDYYITLTTTNKAADQINDYQLSLLRDKGKIFTGAVKGKFDQKQCPTKSELLLKVGAQVMMLNNDTEGRWANGSIGKIIDIFLEDSLAEHTVVVELNDGTIAEVRPYTWNLYQYWYDDHTRSLETNVVGSFTQYPLRLAWAVTIHKSQGKTFDNVMIDIGRGAFAPGQVYVALSRCRTLQGLKLKRPIQRRHIWSDERVIDYLRDLKNYQPVSRQTLF